MDDSWPKLERSACEGELVDCVGGGNLPILPPWQPAPEGEQVDFSAEGSRRS